MQAQPLTRRFIYQGSELADPNTSLNAEQVRDVLVTSHPELANAALDGPVLKNGVQEYTFIRSVGTKG